MIIGSTTFKSKKDCKDHARELRDNIGPTLSLKTSNPSAYTFFTNLFQYHPNPEKISFLAESKDISIEVGERGGVLIFRLIHETPGSSLIIGFEKCFKSSASLGEKTKSSYEESTFRDNLERALRYNISDQIRDFMEESVNVDICELCNKPIKKYHITHIDHIITFKTLKERFHELYINLPIPTTFIDVDVVDVGDKTFLPEDELYRTSWQLYHACHSSLRKVHELCNLRRSEKD